MAEAFPRGRFSWHELMTTDTAAAVSFYTQITGWRTRAWEEDPSYTLWINHDEPIGGLMVLPEDARRMGAPPNWLAYVAVPDAAATIRQATGLGGEVVAGPQEVPVVGKWAVLKDPQGAVFAILQPAGPPGGHDGEPKRGEFSWHELATTDWKAAWEFYRALFGWQKTNAMDMGPPLGTYQIYGRAGRDLGGMYNKPPDMAAPPHWLCYVKVPSADTAAATVRRLGGQVLNGPMDVPGGDRIAQCLDPQGAAFAVHSVAVTAPKPAPRPMAKPTAKPPSKPAAATPAEPTARKPTAPKRVKKARKAKTAKKAKKAVKKARRAKRR